MNGVTSKLLKCCKLPNILGNPSRTAAHWNKDWMPGPYPVTPEQRLAAAKKYNLLPEEYEPDPDGYGDYPKLPDVSGDTRDSTHNWDFPELKKEYGEPMHVYANFISEDRWDINHNEKQQIHPLKQTAMYIGVLLAIFIPYHFLNDKKTSLAHAKRHYPADGVHYKYP
ncbi:NADH dehydrogenase 1 beta subcomplex subunit 8 ndufb8 [Homalodisca vitripennis]|nr:NADH dehydrogenase 1 beta subcomplex subunit 8 ndufb8 [Homalodisca vitripennis]